MSKIDTLIDVKPIVDLKIIKESLNRIGIPNKKNKILYPSCYLWQNFEKYYVVHFKELFLLEKSNGYNNLSDDDKERKNSIIFCLKNWGLVDVDEKKIEPHGKFVYVLPFKDKKHWKIEHKYNIKNSMILK